MALSICPECGQNVSNRATACPKCGYPLQRDPVSAPAQPSDQKVQTIQFTRKRYKFMQLMGSVLLCLGLINLLSAGQATWPLGVGLLITLVSKALIWWHHG